MSENIVSFTLPCLRPGVVDICSDTKSDILASVKSLEEIELEKIRTGGEHSVAPV